MSTGPEQVARFIVGHDFQVFMLGKDVYYLTPTQARAFACLLTAWAQGMGLAASFILETAQSESTKLSDVYKRGADGNAVFKRFIRPVRGTRGIYSLELPEELRGRAASMIEEWVNNLIDLACEGRQVKPVNLSKIIDDLVRSGLIQQTKLAGQIRRLDDILTREGRRP